jgi:hypothetical protein
MDIQPYANDFRYFETKSYRHSGSVLPPPLPRPPLYWGKEAGNVRAAPLTSASTRIRPMTKSDASDS